MSDDQPLPLYVVIAALLLCGVCYYLTGSPFPPILR